MKPNRFAEAVRASLEGGFQAQALAHGAELHRQAVAIRSRDPLAAFLLDTFTRQTRERGRRAQDYQAAGNRRAAMEQATAALAAADNARRVREAIEA